MRAVDCTYSDFVLTMRDIEKTVSFYTSVLGMEKALLGQKSMTETTQRFID